MATLPTQHILKAEIRPVRYVDILDSPQAEALLREYGHECSIPKIGQPSPQRHIYENMEASGLMHSFGVYKGKELVGFATLLIFVLPHYGKKVANVESLFVAQAHRSGGLGLTLMAEIEKFAKQMQCEAILYNARRGSRLDIYLIAMPNYERTNSVFVRSLA